MARGIGLKISVETSDASQYSDDAMGESIQEFISGTAEYENNDLTDDVLSDLLGHALSEDGELTAGGNDNPPYVRLGQIARRVLGNQVSYKAIILMKAKFSIPSEEYQTKADKVSLQAVNIQANLLMDSEGVWKRQKTFPTLAAAVEYLNQWMNMEAAPLELTVAAGTESGKAAVTVREAGEGLHYLVSVSPAAGLPGIHEVPSGQDGWEPWDGKSEITVKPGGQIVVAEVSQGNKTVSAGRIFAPDLPASKEGKGESQK